MSLGDSPLSTLPLSTEAAAGVTPSYDAALDTRLLRAERSRASFDASEFAKAARASLLVVLTAYASYSPSGDVRLLKNERSRANFDSAQFEKAQAPFRHHVLSMPVQSIHGQRDPGYIERFTFVQPRTDKVVPILSSYAVAYDPTPDVFLIKPRADDFTPTAPFEKANKLDPLVRDAFFDPAVHPHLVDRRPKDFTATPPFEKARTAPLVTALTTYAQPYDASGDWFLLRGNRSTKAFEGEGYAKPVSLSPLVRDAFFVADYQVHLFGARSKAWFVEPPFEKARVAPLTTVLTTVFAPYDFAPDIVIKGRARDFTMTPPFEKANRLDPLVRDAFFVPGAQVHLMGDDDRVQSFPAPDIFEKAQKPSLVTVLTSYAATYDPSVDVFLIRQRSKATFDSAEFAKNRTPSALVVGFYNAAPDLFLIKLRSRATFSEPPFEKPQRASPAVLGYYDVNADMLHVHGRTRAPFSEPPFEKARPASRLITDAIYVAALDVVLRNRQGKEFPPGQSGPPTRTFPLVIRDSNVVSNPPPGVIVAAVELLPPSMTVDLVGPVVLVELQEAPLLMALQPPMITLTTT